MQVNRWLSVRLEFIGAAIVFCTAAVATFVLPTKYVAHLSTAPLSSAMNRKCRVCISHLILVRLNNYITILSESLHTQGKLHQLLNFLIKKRVESIFKSQ